MMSGKSIAKNILLLGTAVLVAGVATAQQAAAPAEQTFEGTVKVGLGKYMYLPQARGFDIITKGFDAATVVDKYVRLKGILLADKPSLFRADSIEVKDASGLGRVDFLSPLSQEERQKLVENVGMKEYAAGEMTFRQGDAGDSFYIIKKGIVDVIVEKEPGAGVVVATLGPGNFFGEMSLLTGAARTATIRAKEDAEFVVIDRESFRGTLANNPSIAESLSRILAERQAALAAQREKLDTATLERRKRDESGQLLRNIREFFGLHN